MKKLRLSCRKKENLKRWRAQNLLTGLRNPRFQTAKGKSARHHQEKQRAIQKLTEIVVGE